jgi:lysozyme
MDLLKQRIIAHEGLKLKPYKDTVGKLTIGVGRNLDDCGISEDEALGMLDHDLTRCQLELLQFKWYLDLDEVRKGVIIELVFNMGLTKVLMFKNMISFLIAKDYENASKELLDSAWAKQVGVKRSKTLADVLKSGRN